MNGIIFHGKSAKVGCEVEFLFEPDLIKEPEQAIAEFSSGEKAYAEITRDIRSFATVRLGEHFVGGVGKISETSWLLSYNEKLKLWEVVNCINNS